MENKKSFNTGNLIEIAKLFLKLGIIAFGGLKFVLKDSVIVNAIHV